MGVKDLILKLRDLANSNKLDNFAILLTQVVGTLSVTDVEELDDILTSAIDPVDIKTAYESNPDTNAFDDSEQTKLAGVPSDTQSQLDAKLNHFTGVVDNAIMRSDGSGGTAVQESSIFIDNNGHMLPATHDLQNLGSLTDSFNILYAEGINLSSNQEYKKTYFRNLNLRLDFDATGWKFATGGGGSDVLWPATDNVVDFGKSGQRWKNGYFSGNFEAGGQVYSVHDTESGSGTTHTIDWNEGNSTTVDLNDFSGDVTFSFSNPQSGANYIIKAIQQATARNIIWPGEVLWPGGTPPTISAGDDDEDMIYLFYDGVNYYGRFGQDYQ